MSSKKKKKLQNSIKVLTYGCLIFLILFCIHLLNKESKSKSLDTSNVKYKTRLFKMNDGSSQNIQSKYKTIVPSQVVTSAKSSKKTYLSGNKNNFDKEIEKIFEF